MRVIATTRLRPTAAPHTEMIKIIMGIGVCEIVSEAEVYTTRRVNSRSIMVSIHIKATIKCLC